MDIFDILGPVMVGPSSSHTAGAARIGAMARTLLGEEVADAKLHLYGSFAETGKGHGTGHGVGYLLSVHEGPQRIHWSIASNARHTALEPGMIFSDEPGLYLAGKFGVRLENLLLVREAETNAYGRFLSLEPLTLAPFDRDTIDPSLLSDRELAQLNAYHARVYEALAPHLDAETRVWLRGVAAPLGK